MIRLTTAASIAALSLASAASAQTAQPWMNTKLSPDERAALLEKELTLDERIGLVHGPMSMPIFGIKKPEGAIGSAGYIPGISRLGVPALEESDASLGVTNPLGVRPGDGATALASGLSLAATFNTKLAYEGGAVVGREARAKGFNVQLAGGVNLARDPRNGRNFEYLGEDPWLAANLAAAQIRGIQDQGIVSTIKHFSLNGQETSRHFANSVIDEAAHRESDLLAFQIAIEKGQPGSVMCAYNLVNGDYSCGNPHLLKDVLKGDWGYKGWVMSDWGAVHATDYILKGLDQQSGEQLDAKIWFGEPLKAAVEKGEVPAARLADASRRILRSMFAAGLFDKPVTPGGAIDYDANAQIARAAATEGVVLLKNREGLLPLAKTAKTIAVIGGHADAGVLSGGGSSQVVPPGGAKRVVPLGGEGMMGPFRSQYFNGSSPLAAIRKAAPDAKVTFDDGRYVASAVAAAKAADIVVVFGNQWMGEGEDAFDLSLPNGQDELIAAVTAANPNAVVVLQTGGPVAMPWLNDAGAVVEAWYSGAKGGEAIADVLFGAVNPSGRLPMTFPASLSQYPREALPGRGLPEKTQFDVPYIEGADVGYRRFAVTGDKPLFPFGYGLSYTTFAYSNLKLEGGASVTVSFDVANTGRREGKDVPQVYLTGAAGKPLQRLIGFDKVSLKPGETRRVTVTADPRLLASFDAKGRRWVVTGGDYQVAVGASAADLALKGGAKVKARTLKP
ncbi:beta-glucosidase family protein [Caulobacter hibisci]|uniref:Glycoside hydrolase family 3 C-terminal domain-containing protein n=1 Tax=Caulobacter hibisci TaxID=2035993 RepID=A0ABS0STN4_9CAUL|nr:glycoside hydrolase family 3 C-terminal domain-containing protein [Caulobacter hibisci]MBI1682869.1 glycoside hydrolase family 3 C-terminal domain-containing protein [Caulobacter hibisci]